jgi:hypothetical protein
MRITFILCFVLLSTFVFGQRIKGGKLAVEPQGDGLYKIYLQEKPRNTTYPLVDSTSYRITFICPSGAYEVRDFGLTDTLWYNLESGTTLSPKAIWHRQNGISFTHIPIITINQSNWVGCFEETDAPSVPIAVSPEVNIIDGVVYSSLGGTIVVLGYPQLNLLNLETFDDPFGFQLPSGDNWVYIFYPNGEIIQLGVINVP